MKPGILIISHGSREAGWVRLVDDAAAAVAASETCKSSLPDGGAVPVVSVFLEIVEGRLIQDGIDSLVAEGVKELYVLPLFVSSGSTHVDDIAQAFGLPPVSAERPGELEPFRVPADVRVYMGQPIDDDIDGDIVGLLLGNIAELSETPASERLLLVAHGAREDVFHERYREGMTQLAARMCALGGFAGADIAMLLPDQAAGKLRAMQEQYPEHPVIVAPLFLSEGYFTRTVIPKRLEGFAYRYNGRALLPSPLIARWMERQIGQWLSAMGADGAGRLGS
ncbi:sirohydrochlorin chelatase [Paenibacillus sacheonensis]|uniref:Cobalamin biosynthesis protein CbiX n=1 Tax=Paenibacillus sacheonensis TaxID=742054 RepID=A0A7X4YWV5_9BACL|nr:CbiX/SirB N-terminal domain-containing protein [Paenibacillus sacheonensis]MBM7568072.1 sirohydrochlorin ferrochelatase [Paenibacillus sacheonensis]NBC72899.1 cobalamin biosynthesis protein CbiX [Paenibacillus sacheonensis]